MSTYTTSLGLERITPGDQPGLWGNTTNNNLNLIDQAITGVTPISFAALSGQTYTLTDFDGAVDEARSAVLNITGIAAGPNTVIIPNKQKTYLVRNNTGQNVVFQTPVPTATYTVGAGNSILIFCDGNNNVFTGIASPSVGTLSVSAGGTGATTFTAGFVKSTGGTNALTSSATVDLTSDVTGVLPVARGGTGAGTYTAGSLLIGNGTSNFGTLVGGGVGQVATWNGSQWTAQTPAAASGVASFNGRTGPVLPQAGDYSSFYAPAGSYASLSANQTWTGTQTANGSFLSDGKWRTTFGGYTSALCADRVQLGVSTAGIIYNTFDGSVSFGNNPGINATCFSSTFYVNTDSTTRPTGGPWLTFSDSRLKENVVNYTKGLSAITALRPVNYTLKGELGEQTKHKVCTGLIAQEVLETPLSSMITTNEKDQYVLDANEVTWALVNAVKELKAELDAAKAEIAALKAQ